MNERRIKLLIIDDDEISVFILKKFIEKIGRSIDIDVCANGELAVEYFCERTGSKEHSYPDLMLVDINMPIMNGWKFLDAYEMMDHPAHVLTYMLSSSVYENDIKKATTYPSVKGFISKPLHIDRLKALFSEVDEMSN